MNSEVQILPERFLVRPLEEDHTVLIGLPVATEAEFAGAASRSLSYVTFYGGQVTETLMDEVTGLPLEFVRVQPTFAGQQHGFLLPPLAASLAGRPSRTSAFRVRTDNLLYLTTPTSSNSMRAPPSEEDAMQSRTLYIRFCSAPVPEPLIRNFVHQSLGCTDEIEQINYVDLGRAATVLLSNSSSADQKMWLASANKRCLYLTFDEKEDEVTEAELFALFNSVYPNLESVRFQNASKNRKPLHAYAYFFGSATVHCILQYQPKFLVAGKSVLAKAYKPRCLAQ